MNQDFGLGTLCELVLKSLIGGKHRDRPTSLHTRAELLKIRTREFEQRTFLEGALRGMQ